MQISAPDEVVRPRRQCALHFWEVQSSGRTTEVEVYTCRHCGAQWRRTISWRGGGHQNGKLPHLPWPTWDDIISEP